MKRSEINGLMRDSLAFFQERAFRLPPWATWGPQQWRSRGPEVREIVSCMLGWDLTDFGSGQFDRRGLILFTLRNGSPGETGRKPYAEKAMIVREGQETPFHFHWSKTEDIINRGGGNLVIELNGSTPEEDLSSAQISVQVDGITRTVQAGGRVVLTPGESICLEPRVYHRFFGEPGKGRILVGEVSAVNDDTRDNRFHEAVGRFPAIDEDEEALYLLATDYPRYVPQALGR
jgi:D-lyxose ketol-isomerase